MMAKRIDGGPILTLEANLTLLVLRPRGLRPRLDPFESEFLWFERVHNLVPLTGRNIVRDLLGRSVPELAASYAPTHLALGTDSTVTVDTQVKLNSEAFRNELVGRTPADSKITFQGFVDIDDGNGNTYTEAGLFDNAVTNNGNMLARATFSPIVKTSAVQIVVNWDITITSS